MIDDFSRITSFIRSMIEDDEGELGALYRQAVKDGVPVIRPEAKELLKTQLMMKKPKHVLEVGTAIGYSSLFMSNYLPEDADIVTLELDEERASQAEENITRFGKADRITVLRGDAAKLLTTLPDLYYDFVFVDAAKAQYIYYLPEVLRVCKPDGVIISDNILQEGDVLESHFLVEKRNRTIHDRMREYLYTITHHEALETALLSVGDGMAISIKKELE